METELHHVPKVTYEAGFESNLHLYCDLRTEICTVLRGTTEMKDKQTKRPAPAIKPLRNYYNVRIEKNKGAEGALPGVTGFPKDIVQPSPYWTQGAE